MKLRDRSLSARQPEHHDTQTPHAMRSECRNEIVQKPLASLHEEDVGFLPRWVTTTTEAT